MAGKCQGAETNLSKIDYALNAEISYSYKVVEIGARYTHGLSNIRYMGNPDPELFQSEKQVGKNRSLQFYLAFAIKKCCR